MPTIDLSPQMTTILIGTAGALVLLLLVSFLSRPRVFTQYLRHMTGITLSPRDVARVFHSRGKAGVREMFLELIIQQDLKQGPMTPPDPASRAKKG